MKAWLTAAIAAVLVLPLMACSKKEEAPAAAASGLFGQRGRYVAVGVYSPGPLWEHLAPSAQVPGKTAGSDPADANLQDDDEVLVVMDGATGELRQCGNLSGHCIGFNPWALPLGAEQTAPTALLKHAAELRAEAEAARKADEARLSRLR